MYFHILHVKFDNVRENCYPEHYGYVLKEHFR